MGRSKLSLLVALLALGWTVPAWGQNVDFSGQWGSQRSVNLNGPRAFLDGGPAQPGRSSSMVVEQNGEEIQVTETRRAGERQKVSTFFLVANGEPQSVTRFGREETVTVSWQGRRLVLEVAEKWRETWELAGDDSLRIRRESLRSPRGRTVVLSRQGGES